MGRKCLFPKCDNTAHWSLKPKVGYVFQQPRINNWISSNIIPDQWCSLHDTQVYGVYPLAKVKDFPYTHLKKHDDT